MEKFKKQCTSGAGGSYCPATDKSDLYSWWEQVKTESTSTLDRKAPFVIEVGEGLELESSLCNMNSRFQLGHSYHCRQIVERSQLLPFLVR